MTHRGAALKSKTRTSADRAGLQFSVSRIHRFLKDGYYAPHISILGSVFCAAVLEYLTSEMLELAGDSVLSSNKKRITPRHILLAVRRDDELNKLLEDVTIPEGGVVPNIHAVLLPKGAPNVEASAKVELQK
ncbi:late histone H2A.1-like [Panulirus ornatus]|uniref:late histone H2A.1-like n=1 Tax=Panulirus ornatus TaxID=150431 RepID=UPI003A8AD077